MIAQYGAHFAASARSAIELLINWALSVGFFSCGFVSVVVCVTGSWTIGGKINFLLISPMRVPKWRTAYRVWTRDILGFSFLFKLITFIIQSSGALWPYLFVYFVFPVAAVNHPFLIGMLLAVTWAAFRLMTETQQMHTRDYYDVANAVGRKIGMEPDILDRFMNMRLARANFADETFVNLLRLISFYGTTLCCAFALGWLGNSKIGTPLVGLVNALAFLRIVLGSTTTPSTVVGYIINGFYGLCLAFYTIMFISLSARLIDEVPGAEHALRKQDA